MVTYVWSPEETLNEKYVYLNGGVNDSPNTLDADSSKKLASNVVNDQTGYMTLFNTNVKSKLKEENRFYDKYFAMDSAAVYGLCDVTAAIYENGGDKKVETSIVKTDKGAVLFLDFYNIVGKNGADGASGLTNYLDIRYATGTDELKFFTGNHGLISDGAKYMGTYVSVIPVPKDQPRDINEYSWSKVAGEKGDAGSSVSWGDLTPEQKEKLKSELRGDDGQPGINGTDGVATFKSIVFKRINAMPDTPTGGTFVNPVPDGWSDGVPAGDAMIWMSTRMFYSDGREQEEGPRGTSWTTPAIASDNENMEYEFNSGTTKPNPPTKQSPSEPPKNPDENGWYDDAFEAAIWMAMCKVSNGELERNSDGTVKWTITKIKGEDGLDGTSFQLGDSWDTAEKFFTTEGKAGEYHVYSGNEPAYKDFTGYLFVWNASETVKSASEGFIGTHWFKQCRFEGKPGQSYYTHIKYANKVYDLTDTEVVTSAQTVVFITDGTLKGNILKLTGKNEASRGEETGNFIGVKVDAEEQDNPVASAYTWTKWVGRDGYGMEYVYKSTLTEEAPLAPKYTLKFMLDTIYQKEDFIPDNYPEGDVRNLGWIDDPVEVSEATPYVWVAHRKYADIWSSFTGTYDEVTDDIYGKLFARYAKDGKSPDARFTSIVFKSNTGMPEAPHNESGVTQDGIEYNTFNSPIPNPSEGWTDTITADQVGKSIWMSTRIFSTEPDFELLNLWSTPTNANDTDTTDREWTNLFDEITNPSYFREHETVGPLKETPDGPELNENWSDEPIDKAVWMAECKVINGDFERYTDTTQPLYGKPMWKFSKVKGEKGDAGMSIILKDAWTGQKLFEAETTPSIAATLEMNEAHACSEYYSGITEDSRRLEFIVNYLYVWDGDSWVNAGKFTGENAYLHIKYANKSAEQEPTGNNFYDEGNDVWLEFTAGGGEAAGDYTGTLSDNIKDDTTIGTAYTWVYNRGADGHGYEYIFTLWADRLAPPLPHLKDDPRFEGKEEYTGATITDTSALDFQKDDYVPVVVNADWKWYDNPQDTTLETPFLFKAVRTKRDGVWGNFEGPNSTALGAIFENSYVHPGQSNFSVAINDEMDIIPLNAEDKTSVEWVEELSLTAFYGTSKTMIQSISAVYDTGVTSVVSTAITDGIAYITFKKAAGTPLTATEHITIKLKVLDRDEFGDEIIGKEVTLSRTYCVCGAKRGKDGVAYSIDLTNEIATIGLGGDAILDVVATAATKVVVSKGTTNLSIANLIVGVPSGWTAPVTSTTGDITVTVNKGTDFSQSPAQNLAFKIPVSAITNEGYSAVTIFTIMGNKSGKDGESLNILSNYSQIKKDKYGVLTPATTEEWAFSAMSICNGVSTGQIVNFGFVLDGDTEKFVKNVSACKLKDASITQMPTSALSVSIYDTTNNTLLDKELFPVLLDGIDGDIPYVIDLSNQIETIGIGSDGILDIDCSAYTDVRMYRGEELQELTDIKLGIPTGSGLIYTATPQNGKVVVGIPAGTDFIGTETKAENSAFKIPVSAVTVNGYSATTVFTIMGNALGQDGYAFKIQSNASQIIYDSGRMPQISASEWSFSSVTVYNGEIIPYDTDFKFVRDGRQEKVIEGINACTYEDLELPLPESSLTLTLMDNTMVLDVETFPAIYFGENALIYNVKTDVNAIKRVTETEYDPGVVECIVYSQSGTTLVEYPCEFYPSYYTGLTYSFDDTPIETPYPSTGITINGSNATTRLNIRLFYDGIEWERNKSVIITKDGEKGEAGFDGASTEYVYMTSSLPIEFTEKIVSGHGFTVQGGEYIDEDWHYSGDVYQNVYDFVPSGWTDNPIEVTYLMPYEYVTKRSRTLSGTSEDQKMVWSAFAIPKLWAKFSFDGKELSSVTEYYIATSAMTPEPVVSSSTASQEWWKDPVWGDWTRDKTPTNFNKTNRFLWNVEYCHYTDGVVDSDSVTNPAMIGTYADGFKKIIEYYCLSNDDKNHPSGYTENAYPASNWKTVAGTTSSGMPFLWNFELMEFNDGSIQTFTPALIGARGKDGTNVWKLDLTNDIEMIGLAGGEGGDFVLDVAASAHTKAILYYGDDTIPVITAITMTLPTGWSSYTAKTGDITIGIPAGTSFDREHAENMAYKIPISAATLGHTGSTIFTVAGTKEGKDGSYFRLRSNYDVVKMNEKAVLTPKTPAEWTFSSTTICNQQVDYNPAYFKAEISVTSSTAVTVVKLIDKKYNGVTFQNLINGTGIEFKNLDKVVITIASDTGFTSIFDVETYFLVKDGENAVRYWLDSNTLNVNYNPNTNVLTNNNVSVTAKTQTGSRAIQNYSGKTTYCWITGSTITEEKVASAVTVTVSDIDKYSILRFKLYSATTNTVLNYVDISLTREGKNGEDAIMYFLRTSDTEIKAVLSAGTFVPSVITVNAYKQKGNNTTSLTGTPFNMRYYYATTGGTQTVPVKVDCTQNMTITLNTAYLNYMFLVIKLYNGDTELDNKTLNIMKDGLVGASVRGPVNWDTHSGDTRRWCNGEINPSNQEDAKWIDIVVHNGKYYRCTVSHNGPETGWTSSAWAEASQYDFVATNVLLASNAKIDFLGSNEILLKDSSGKTTGGARGGDGINFWAGSDNSNNAPFRVDNQGHLTAMTGTFAGVACGIAQINYKLITQLPNLNQNYSADTTDVYLVVNSSAFSDGDGNPVIPNLILPNPTEKLNGVTYRILIESRPVGNKSLSAATYSLRLKTQGGKNAFKIFAFPGTPSGSYSVATYREIETYGGVLEITCIPIDGCKWCITQCTCGIHCTVPLYDYETEVDSYGWSASTGTVSGKKSLKFEYTLTDYDTTMDSVCKPFNFYINEVGTNNVKANIVIVNSGTKVGTGYTFYVPDCNNGWTSSTTAYTNDTDTTGKTVDIYVDGTHTGTTTYSPQRMSMYPILIRYDYTKKLPVGTKLKIEFYSEKSTSFEYSTTLMPVMGFSTVGPQNTVTMVRMASEITGTTTRYDDTLYITPTN